jgi:hypothetical protein
MATSGLKLFAMDTRTKLWKAIDDNSMDGSSVRKYSWLRLYIQLLISESTMKLSRMWSFQAKAVEYGKGHATAKQIHRFLLNSRRLGQPRAGIAVENIEYI